MNKNKSTLTVQFIFLIFLIIFALFVGYYLGRQENIARATTGFDHSQCQYPNRSSNPIDGCDNTDPARPECMKSGIEDCDLPTMEPIVPIVETSSTPEPVVTITRCE